MFGCIVTGGYAVGLLRYPGGSFRAIREHLVIEILPIDTELCRIEKKEHLPSETAFTQDPWVQIMRFSFTLSRVVVNHIHYRIEFRHVMIPC